MTLAKPLIIGKENMMKIATILGTRPEIIRLSLIIPKLDALAEKHTLIHTGQNYDPSLNDVFFRELQLRQPDIVLQTKGGIGEQLGVLFRELEPVLHREKPDKVLVLGDTNSALSALLAERMGISVVHMEAGNRCFDLSVPEEKNRRVIDAVSTYNLPYTEYSKTNLMREGFPSGRIVVTGNPIYEVIKHYTPQIEASQVLSNLNLQPQEYFLVTAHRAENVDCPEALKQIVDGLNAVAEHYDLPLICSIHPRTSSRLQHHPAWNMHPRVQFFQPFGFFDFVRLEQHAKCVLTDSGTVQEECCIFQVPAVTMRNSTERPETVDCGSNVVSGVHAKRIFEGVRTMIAMEEPWECPRGYCDPHVSSKVVRFLLGARG
jgi:UDP-N-acetylglucosamine 2-epimerase (non-hydrolysing)